MSSALIIFRRALLPAIVVVAGTAMIVYGAVCHLIPVLEETTITKTIDLPSPFDFEGPPMADENGPEGGGPEKDANLDEGSLPLPGDPPFPGDPPVPGDRQFQGNQPFPGEPPMAPPPFMKKPPKIQQEVTQIDRATILDREPKIVREVTVGGVVRLDTGEIKRTYDPKSGKGPALCPT